MTKVSICNARTANGQCFGHQWLSSDTRSPHLPGLWCQRHRRIRVYNNWGKLTEFYSREKKVPLFIQSFWQYRSSPYLAAFFCELCPIMRSSFDMLPFIEFEWWARLFCECKNKMWERKIWNIKRHVDIKFGNKYTRRKQNLHTSL